MALAAGLGTQYASPLFNDCTHFDLNIYHTIGREIVSGALTYRDLVDHKGPALHFIFALAALVSPASESFTGVMYMFILVYFLAFVFVERTARLFIDGIYPQIIAASFAVAMIDDMSQAQAVAFTYPLHVASLYYFIKHLKLATPPAVRVWFLWGVCFSIALLIKIPYAIAWGFAPAYWAYAWFRDPRIKKGHLRDGIALFSGVILMPAAFAAYFIYHGALGDFVFWYIKFNALYYPETKLITVIREHVTLVYFELPKFILTFAGAFLILPKLPGLPSKLLFLSSFIFGYVAMILPGRCTFSQCMAPFIALGLVAPIALYAKNVSCGKIPGYTLCLLLTVCLVWNMGYLQRRIDGIGPNPIQDRHIKWLSDSYLEKYKSQLKLNQLRGTLFSPLSPVFYRISGLRVADKHFFPLAVSEERFPDVAMAFRATIDNGKADWIILPRDYINYSWASGISTHYALSQTTDDGSFLLFGRLPVTEK